jgi:hypothetical protein
MLELVRWDVHGSDEKALSLQAAVRSRQRQAPSSLRAYRLRRIAEGCIVERKL